MYNYINEEKLFAWYDSVAKAPLSHKALLAEVARRYLATRRAVFELSAGETLSGQAESYAFRFENIGCCGASTIYFYF